MALQSQPVLSDGAHDLLATFDDVDQHLAFEYDPEQYSGISTIGFAHIKGIDGRKSFYTRLKELADNSSIDQFGVFEEDSPTATFSEGAKRSAGGAVADVTTDRRGDIQAEIGQASFRISEAYDGGRRMSLSNIRDFQPGPEHQRLDVRERLHALALDRFRYNGYLGDARVSSRID